jgi:hypothetical protein
MKNMSLPPWILGFSQHFEFLRLGTFFQFLQKIMPVNCFTSKIYWLQKSGSNYIFYAFMLFILFRNGSQNPKKQLLIPKRRFNF